jgi:hypothetical protein
MGIVHGPNGLVENYVHRAFLTVLTLMFLQHQSERNLLVLITYVVDLLGTIPRAK